MTKTDAIARLEELSGLLGRTLSTEGNLPVLTARIAEAEAELEAQADTFPGDDGSQEAMEVTPITDKDGRVLVHADVTFQTVSDKKRLMCLKGEEYYLDPQAAADAITEGLATPVCEG